ncbi:MAG TPA: SRPBCC family protein, partial [Myxococcota bacterium]
PGKSHVERSGTVNGTPALVFARLNSMKSFPLWSPWQQLDPNMNKTFSGPDEGVGSSYWWSGNDDVGEGKMTITESRPGEGVVDTLEFIRPFAQESVVTFTVKPASDTTSTVTWAMDGDNGFMAKAAGLFMDMDTMIGADFERGLKNLDTVVSADAKKAAEDAAAAKAQADADAAALAAAAAAAVPVDGAAPVEGAAAPVAPATP